MRGRNWQYSVAPTVTLLRNVGSIDPRYDGWILSAADGWIHIMPQTALLILRGLRERNAGAAS